MTQTYAHAPLATVRAGVDIDAVVAWVDGADEAHAAKRRRYLAAPPTPGDPVERVASTARRFSDNDEIRYCLRSIRHYAPWIRKVWLITDSQVPRSIRQEVAEAEGIAIVDHREIFRELEVALPTFNSLAIETVLGRIPGLADRFIYFNDDMFLSSPASPSDFFSEGRPILRGKWQPWSTANPISFHDQNRRNGVELLGLAGKDYFAAAHVCHPMLKEVIEASFDQHLPAFVKNAAFRFRNRDQFWPISVHDHLALSAGKAVIYSGTRRDWQHFSVKFCKTAEADMLIERLTRFANHDVRLGCINYMESVSAKVPEAIKYLDRAAGPKAAFER